MFFWKKMVKKLTCLLSYLYHAIFEFMLGYIRGNSPIVILSGTIQNIELTDFFRYDLYFCNILSQVNRQIRGCCHWSNERNICFSRI